MCRAYWDHPYTPITRAQDNKLIMAVPGMHLHAALLGCDTKSLPASGTGSASVDNEVIR